MRGSEISMRIPSVLLDLSLTAPISLWFVSESINSSSPKAPAALNGSNGG